MRSEEELAGDIQKGINANSVIENAEFQGAFVGIKAMLVESFINSKHGDSADRDEIWRKLQSLQWVEDTLVESIESGKIAMKQLESRSNIQ